MFNPSHEIYIVFDLETTGFSKERHHIIEIACEMLYFDGTQVPSGKFSALVRPPYPIPYYIQQLTGIVDEMVYDQGSFEKVGNDFIWFIQEKAIDIEDEKEYIIERYIFVAHNGHKFDVPFLFWKLQSSEMFQNSFIKEKSYVLDMLELAKGCAQQHDLIVPDNYKLSTLYNYVTTLQGIDNAHRAEADVLATVQILLFYRFWQERREYIRKVNTQGQVELRRTSQTTEIARPQGSPNDDSDTQEEDGYQTDTEMESDDEAVNPTTDNNEPDIVIGNDEHTVGWQRDTPFEGVDTTTLFTQEFQQRYTRTSSTSVVMQTGVQCSQNSINSPLKSWRQIFTNSILDKMVRYTNEYGENKLGDWNDISRSDLTDLFSILFIASIQKERIGPLTGGVIIPY